MNEEELIIIQNTLAKQVYIPSSEKLILPKQNDLILDTHTGSASSLIAFEDMGFNYVAYEIDTDYYNSAVKRLEQFRSEPKFGFAEQPKTEQIEIKGLD